MLQYDEVATAVPHSLLFFDLRKVRGGYSPFSAEFCGDDLQIRTTCLLGALNLSLSVEQAEQLFRMIKSALVERQTKIDCQSHKHYPAEQTAVDRYKCGNCGKYCDAAGIEMATA